VVSHGSTQKVPGADGLEFWLLAASDGHAKNFSIFLLPGGANRLTPRHDILSAHPMLGHGHGKLAPENINMAMAVRGKSRHYGWMDIRARHFLETARRHGILEMKSIMEDVIARMPGVIERVQSELPPGFPPQMAEATLLGIAKRADQLKAELAG